LVERKKKWPLMGGNGMFKKSRCGAGGKSKSSRTTEEGGKIKNRVTKGVKGWKVACLPYAKSRKESRTSYLIGHLEETRAMKRRQRSKGGRAPRANSSLLERANGEKKEMRLCGVLFRAVKGTKGK